MNNVNYDYRKLFGRIMEKFGRQKAFAEAIGLDEAIVSLKLNNKRGMSQADIERWRVALEIEPSEVYDYFFTQRVQ